MTSQRFASVWDAISASPSEARAMQAWSQANMQSETEIPVSVTTETKGNDMTTENSKAKIITFGKIEGNGTDVLCFSDFHIDAENEFNNQAVAMLTLVIRRLQEELDKELAKPKAHPAIYYATPR